MVFIYVLAAAVAVSLIFRSRKNIMEMYYERRAVRLAARVPGFAEELELVACKQHPWFEVFRYDGRLLCNPQWGVLLRHSAPTSDLPGFLSVLDDAARRCMCLRGIDLDNPDIDDTQRRYLVSIYRGHMNGFMMKLLNKYHPEGSPATVQV